MEAFQYEGNRQEDGKVFIIFTLRHDGAERLAEVEIPQHALPSVAGALAIASKSGPHPSANAETSDLVKRSIRAFLGL